MARARTTPYTLVGLPQPPPQLRSNAPLPIIGVWCKWSPSIDACAPGVTWQLRSARWCTVRRKRCRCKR
eukprot:6190609-Pleurochrysis_carterae.AAC.3